ncbi:MULTISPECIES: type II toxin-antitoxin system PemK/MazF family toxin [Aerococcus]|uniref:Type II toxin-antitoxin system PemK/MazF family toxin n=1 Tax=Aerococcus tenax TaxID=3078812 RepID=A0A5N1BPS7_9LACT|nr:type II toxin-antitoxin system PemK/MazF family toxin [Aerococcus urinae]KAA9241004.1 type II toxin-antitoxin system PemK/MazF family toxin [Aerococcus urinae]MDK6370491.1 type II toxin-antitoxin system PemK/MazF family toxin [Aerococcus urinae]MDK6596837.1 type II toxin-antitoxin system PemK/MazF family toxin [Aerococcus urinae]MDK7302300.1 type II toxin-antitoxin system PemK/MazF family toxin [Aerococcus urinae]MDK7800747.1 type II toxin-antitoxin system PemK/MazF family toxin [Aerococcus
MVMRQGDIFYVNFNPSVGHEQRNSRPAIVLSHDLIFQTSHMAIVAPISTTKRNYPAYYELQETDQIKGKVLLDQTKALDLYHRQVSRENFIERAKPNEFKRIIHRYKLLFDLVDDYQ